MNNPTQITGTWSNGKPRKGPERTTKPAVFNPMFKHKFIPEPPRRDIPNMVEIIDWHIATDYVGVTINTLNEGARRYLTEFVLFLQGRPFIVSKIGSTDLYAEWIAYASSKWSPSTCYIKVFRITGRLCKFLKVRGYMANNPHEICRRPSFHGTPVRPPFTTEEYEKLRDISVGHYLHWAIVCAWATGMSMIDICLLQKSQIDLDRLTINKNRQKTCEPCIIPVKPGSDFHNGLRIKMELHSPFYPNDPQNNVYYIDPELAQIVLRQTPNGNFNTALKRLANKVGVDTRKTFHNFRATMCSDLANSGVSTPMACSITGHKNPNVFKQYVTPDEQGTRDTMNRAMDHREKKAALAMEKKRQL